MSEYRIKILTESDTGALREASRGVDDLSKSTRRLGDASHNAANKKSDLVNAMKKAQGAIPGLSYAIGTVTNAWTLLAAAVVGVVAKIREWNEVVAKNEARIKIFRDLNKEVERFSDNIKQAKLDSEEFGRTLDETLRKGQEVTPKGEGEESARKTSRRFALARSKASAEKELQVATIDRRVAAGEISREEGDRQKLAIEQSFQARTTELNLTEQAELAFISRRVALAEGGRVAQIRGQLPAAESAVTAAKNELDDRKRALKAAMDVAGLDEELKAVPGGRFSELEQMTFMGIASYTDLQKAKQEKESLRAGVLQQRELVAGAESRFGEARSRLAGLRSSAGEAAGSFVSLSGEARTRTEDYSGAFAESQTTGPILALAAGEKARTSELQEAARLQEETARQLREVIQSLGRTFNEARGLRDAINSSLSRNRSNLQSE